MKDNHTARPVRVGLISLGCAKNLNDAEIMLGSLLKDGMEITNNAMEADVVIVNTCSFIDSAQEESVDAILESSELREAKNRGQGLIVSGCLPQRFRDDLPRLLPEVDAFMGIDQVAKVSEIVHGALAKRREKLQKKFQIPNRRLDLPTATQPGWQSPQTASSITHHASRTAVTPPSPILEVTPRPTYIPDYSTPRFRLTPRHFAY